MHLCYSLVTSTSQATHSEPVRRARRPVCVSTQTLGPEPARRHLRADPSLDGRSVYPEKSVSKIEAIKIHDLVPGRHEVIDELQLRVIAGINFRDCSKL